MMNELELIDFLEWDAAVAGEAKRRRREIRELSDPFWMNDYHFIQRYRLSKGVVMELCDELRPYMGHPTRSTDLTVEHKILAALSFFATGSYQRPIGDIAAHSIGQTTMSNVLHEVLAVLNLPQIRAKYIKFPLAPQERRANVDKFLAAFGIPGVLGVIDGTHVALVRPAQFEDRYYCRKQYHSLNAQIICDADQKIINVDASYGGATHDSFVWNNHPLKEHLHQISLHEDVWLLADSGYAQRRSVMTPIANAPQLSPEAYYTKVQCKTRNIVERTIGVLKNRFRCLLVDRKLHYAPTTAGNIINACRILHNICVDADLPVPDDLEGRERVQRDLDEQRRIAAERRPEAQRAGGDLAAGLAARRRLVAPAGLRGRGTERVKQGPTGNKNWILSSHTRVMPKEIRYSK